MKITYIHQYFNTPTMVGGTRSYAIARRLVEMGHEVNMITSSREGAAHRGWNQTTEAGINVYWIGVPYSNNMGYGKRIVSFLTFSIFATLKAVSIKSDIVYATSTPLTIAIPGILCSLFRFIPMVFEVRDQWPAVPIAMGIVQNPVLCLTLQSFEKIVYLFSSAVVALSPDMATGIKRVGCSPDKVTVIPNAADNEIFNNQITSTYNYRGDWSISQNHIVVIYAGALGKVNGVKYVIELAKEMSDNRQFVFVILGQGIEGDYLRKLARESGCLGKNLIFRAPVKKDEMAAVLSTCDIMISTIIPVKELEANSANKVFDGFAAGCCVAINHGGWLAEVVNKHKVGFVLPQTPRGGAEILSTIKSREQLISMKQNSKRIAKDIFNYDVLVKTLENVLINVVNKGR